MLGFDVHVMVCIGSFCTFSLIEVYHVFFMCMFCCYRPTSEMAGNSALSLKSSPTDVRKMVRDEFRKMMGVSGSAVKILIRRWSQLCPSMTK